MNREEYWYSRIEKIADKNINQREIKSIYRSRYNDMEKKLLDFYKKITNGAKLTRTEICQSQHYIGLCRTLEESCIGLKHSLNEEVVYSLTNAYKETYVATGRFLNLDLTTNIINDHMVKTAINTRWVGDGNFSKKIWNNTDELGRRVRSDVLDMIVTGATEATYIKRIMEDFNVGERQARRLIHTEVMHTINAAQLERYKEEGTKKVKIYSPNPERCSVCAEYNGKVFNIDKVPTVPLHPSCHCDYLPYSKYVKDYKEELTNGDKSSIIKEQNKNDITVITDKAIDSVPKIRINGFTDEQNTFIQHQHKELLKYARDNNGNKEVAFVFRKGLTDRAVCKGSDTEIELESALFGKGNELFVMHNHPRNSSYSARDIIFLISSDNVKTFSIVKNDGSIEVLCKNQNYNADILKRDFKKILKKYVYKESDKEYTFAVKKLLSKHSKKGGILEWIK